MRHDAILPDWASVRVLGLDIDGTLTDGFLYWGGPEVGWTQRYCVRDGEAVLRARAAGFQVVPVSRNKTACARARMEGLGLTTEWVGVTDKDAAMHAVCARYDATFKDVCYIGDGYEDAELLAKVGIGCSVPTGHPSAVASARYVTRAPGGVGAAEEVVELLLAAKVSVGTGRPSSELGNRETDPQ